MFAKALKPAEIIVGYRKSLFGRRKIRLDSRFNTLLFGKKDAVRQLLGSLLEGRLAEPKSSLVYVASDYPSELFKNENVFVFDKAHKQSLAINLLGEDVEVVVFALRSVYSKTFSEGYPEYLKALQEQLIVYSLEVLKVYYKRDLTFGSWLSFLSNSDSVEDILNCYAQELKIPSDVRKGRIQFMRDYFFGDNHFYEYSKEVRLWVKQLSEESKINAALENQNTYLLSDILNKQGAIILRSPDFTEMEEGEYVVEELVMEVIIQLLFARYRVTNLAEIPFTEMYIDDTRRYLSIGLLILLSKSSRLKVGVFAGLVDIKDFCDTYESGKQFISYFRQQLFCGEIDDNSSRLIWSLYAKCEYELFWDERGFCKSIAMIKDEEFLYCQGDELTLGYRKSV